MAKIGDLVVLDKMAERNLDIRLAKLPDNLLNCRRVKAGGHVTMGVDAGSASIIMNMALGENGYGAALVIFNREQFNETKKLMESAAEITALPTPHSDPDYPGARMHACQTNSENPINNELDGNITVADYDRSIHTNPDADAWAKFYCSIHLGADLDDMRGWFANAMMAMHDHILGRKEVQTDTCCSICKMPLMYTEGRRIARCQNGHEFEFENGECTWAHLEPLPVSDWPANCDSCTLNEELIGEENCAGCPNHKPAKE